MAGKGMSVHAHEVNWYMTLTTRSTTFVPLDRRRQFELSLVCGQSPADGCAHVCFELLLLGREDGLRWFCAPCVVPIACDVAG